MKPIRVGTRNSPLAMKQTTIVIELLREVHGDVAIEIVPLVTTGDRLLSVSLSKIGGKGLFINEVEQALLEGSIDFAVHSLKDMPAVIGKGLTLAAIPKRAVPSDCLIFREVSSISELPKNARIGTSSLRREFQMSGLRKDIQVESIRGNVGTRLKKMEEQQLDAIVLASAGLERIGWFDAPTHAYQQLDVASCIPAVGQGALAVECRADDFQMIAFLRKINDSLTELLVTEERAFLRVLNGNCEIPVGAYAEKTDGGYRMSGFLGDKELKHSVTQTVEAASITGVGKKLGEVLLKELGEDSR
ncbi:hydroxymethylbilane synthase [Candidatus Enterococcus clewellii]|uniref:Porphobilinogen deaminase n=1 Tax=Candidatus Enterococcus clewellii TaxID=1834193 RepID=A0A242K5K6_9ENTE|nr:hydroxymethylbilane synthase [Enterococcus sp. 9E7_DIV0242]OTP14612.1 porphobilinogen deaminase [Enterococcus sp. 9E7_DIV0242]